MKKSIEQTWCRDQAEVMGGHYLIRVAFDDETDGEITAAFLEALRVFRERQAAPAVIK